MIQGNVLITITTACFLSTIEIYDNRLFLLATFIIWFFFEKVSFDLKSKNFEKTKQVVCFFSFSSNFFVHIYTSSSILKGNWYVWNWPKLRLSELISTIKDATKKKLVQSIKFFRNRKLPWVTIKTSKSSQKVSRIEIWN